jgi:hypothetical protein
MKFLFVTVVPMYLNFATFSKDLFSIGGLCILVARHNHMLSSLHVYF